MSNDQEISARSALVAAAAALFRNGVMSHSGHANLSARLDGERMLLTTEGAIRGLAEEALAVVGLDGSVISGDLDPTNTEIVRMHSEVYRCRPDLGAVIHTHSAALLAFALAGRELPCRYEALLRFGQADSVPVADWAPRGSDRSVQAIVEALKSRPGTRAVLLANHGVLVGAAHPLAAAQLTTVLEEAAEAELSAATLGGGRDLPTGALEQVRSEMGRTRS